MSLKLYPGGFAEYTYPQFQNSQEFVLDSGVCFTIKPKPTSFIQMECSFKHFSVQEVFDFLNENILRVKWGYFKVMTQNIVPTCEF